jgi:hypothetical protein
LLFGRQIGDDRSSRDANFFLFDKGGNFGGCIGSYLPGRVDCFGADMSDLGDIV